MTAASLALTWLTITPPLIPTDWSRLNRQGIYLPPTVTYSWSSYGVQIGLWLVILAALLWMAYSADGGSKPPSERKTWKPTKEVRATQYLPPENSPAPSPNLEKGTIGLNETYFTQHLLVILILLGFALRLYSLDRLPLIIDEIGFAAHASDILHGQQVPIFAPGHNANPSVYSWLVAQAMALFGVNRFAIRLVALLFGTLCIPAIYLLGRVWWSRRVGLIAAAFLATYPAHVFFSRQSLYDLVDPFFAMLALAFLARALPHSPAPNMERGNRVPELSPSGKQVRVRAEQKSLNRVNYYILAGISAACAQYFYHGSRLLLVVMAVYTLLVLGLNRARWRQHIVGLVWMALAVLVLTLPQFASLVAHGLPITGNREALRLPADFGQNSLRAVLAWVGQPDVSPFWLSDAPLLPLLALVACLLGVGICLRRWRDARCAALLVYLALITIFAGAILTAAPLYVRYITAIPAIGLLVAVGAGQPQRLTPSPSNRQGEKSRLTIFQMRRWNRQVPTPRAIAFIFVVLMCLQGMWLSVSQPAEAVARITASQWQEDDLARRAAALPLNDSLVLVVPANFSDVQMMTIGHTIAVYGYRRAVAINRDAPTQLQAQIRVLPGITVVLRVEEP